MEQVIQVLKIFKDATLELSSRDASISMVIPMVTCIISDLEEETEDDRGILGMKRNLKLSMEARFAAIESMDHYAVATILDGKYKRFFFRDATNFERAKSKLVELLVRAMRSENQDTTQVGRDK